MGKRYGMQVPTLERVEAGNAARFGDVLGRCAGTVATGRAAEETVVGKHPRDGSDRERVDVVADLGIGTSPGRYDSSAR